MAGSGAPQPGSEAFLLQRSVRLPLLARRGPRRACLGALLSATALLYTLGLPESGWGNAYYAAAAQAGAQSWRAAFFGALDPGGAITVDKPPASLWLMDLSVRLFGLSSWSLLLPQACCGVAAVGVLYVTVRRQTLWPGAGPDGEARAAATGLFAAAVMALTPVATLMARYDNPDELMVLLLVAAAWALSRAVEGRHPVLWSSVWGGLLGLAFLTKLVQAELVLPAFATALIVAGPGSIWSRLRQLAAAVAAAVVMAAWWIAVVQLTPAARRPWVGSTQDNSVLGLALGYNGLGRVTGQEAGGGAANAVRGTPLRLLTSWAPEASWLLPASLLACGAGLVLSWRAGRRYPVRAALVLWGVWLGVLVSVFTAMRGISHGYYAVEMAPAVAGSLAVGGTWLWEQAHSGSSVVPARRILILGTIATAVWSSWLLASHAAWPLAVAPFPIGAAAVAVLALHLDRYRWLYAALEPSTTVATRSGVLRQTGAVALVLALLLGPATWTMATAMTAHRGADVATGPGPASFRTPPGMSSGDAPGGGVPLVIASAVRTGAPGYRWAAAEVGRHAADLALASRSSVWELGGFSGRDPYPSPGQFADAVRRGEVHYLLCQTADGLGSGGAARLVRQELAAHPARRIGAWSLVDLSGTVPAGSAP